MLLRPKHISIMTVDAKPGSYNAVVDRLAAKALGEIHPLTCLGPGTNDRLQPWPSRNPRTRAC